jgi:hypothetical protein
MMKKMSAQLVVVIVSVILFGTAVSQSPASTPKQVRDGQHDFDWELGTWKLHVQRLTKPLTGSKEWMEMDGTVVGSKIWGGKGNLAEITVDGGGKHIEFLSLRLYNPETGQWSVNFASAGSGTLSTPMFGGFSNGRGEFYDQESFNGKMIMVRFLFMGITADEGRSEQAFSDDGGKTWETNWVNTFTRVK